MYSANIAQREALILSLNIIN